MWAIASGGDRGRMAEVAERGGEQPMCLGGNGFELGSGEGADQDGRVRRLPRGVP